MIQFLERLLSCKSPAEFHRVHRKAGDELSPLEIHWLLDRAFALPQPTQDWLADLSRREYFALDEPQPYEHETITPDVHFYADPAADSSGKRLLVCFCGHANRLMMPIPSFLQAMPSALFDVVVLTDRRREHFLNGIAPVASSFAELTAWIGSIFEPYSYAGVATLGTSGGGLPALRAGILLKAERAVSIGGRFQSHVARIVTGAAALPAFDPLCACVDSSGTLLVAVYGEANEADRETAEQLSYRQPMIHLAIPEHSGHSPFGGLSRGQFQALFGLLLGFQTSEPWSDSERVLIRRETSPPEIQPDAGKIIARWLSGGH